MASGQQTNQPENLESDLINPQLTAWANFYVIVGSAGAALVGLQFVVLTLIAGRRKRPDEMAVQGFSTPTVMYLAGATVISALMSVPWVDITGMAVVLAVVGFAGLFYVVIVWRRIRRQTDYQPDWDDWLWYVCLPFVAFATLTLMAVWLPAQRQVSLLGIGAATLGLLIIGVHNAWDTVTHIIVVGDDDQLTAPNDVPADEARSAQEKSI